MKNPETYEELIRVKKCVDLTKYYELSEDEVEKIYNYLSANPDATIIGNKTSLFLNGDNNSIPQEVINANCMDTNID